MLETERSPAGARPARSDVDGPSRQRPGRYRRAFWLLVLLALVVRVVVVLVTPDYRTIHDDRDYSRIATSVSQGNGYPDDRVRLPGGRVVRRPATYRPPGWPYALGGIYAVFGPDKTAARFVLALLGAGVVALLGLIARQLFGTRVSLWATGLGAVYVPLILVGSSLISETQFLLLELGALASALAARRRPGGWKLALLAGVLAGMAALTRINGVLLLAPIALLLWGRPRRSARALARPALALAAAVLAISPWTIRNAIEVGSFVPVSTESGETLAGTYNRVSDRNRVNPAAWRLVRDTEWRRIKSRGYDSVTLDKKLRGAALDYVRAHPLYPLKVAFWNARRLLDLEGQTRWRFEGRTIDVEPGWADAGVYAFWLTSLIAIAGLLDRRVRRTLTRAPRAIWLAPALLVLSALFVIGETPRFRAPVDPFLVLGAAAALGTWPLLRRAPVGG